jgi:hypothetical protein
MFMVFLLLCNDLQLHNVNLQKRFFFEKPPSNNKLYGNVCFNVVVMRKFAGKCLTRALYANNVNRVARLSTGQGESG